MNTTNDENQQKGVFVDEQTQKELNTPLSDPSGVGQENEKFLNLVISLIKEGKINLYQPSTLINQTVYVALPKEKQGKVDFEAMNLLTAIREIKGLYEAGYKDSYQMENLVERVRNTKERLETEGGDLFII